MDVYLWIIIFWAIICILFPVGLMWALHSGVKKGLKAWDDTVFASMEKLDRTLKERVKTLRQFNKDREELRKLNGGR